MLSTTRRRCAASEQDHATPQTPRRKYERKHGEKSEMARATLREKHFLFVSTPGPPSLRVLRVPNTPKSRGTPVRKNVSDFLFVDSCVTATLFSLVASALCQTYFISAFRSTHEAYLLRVQKRTVIARLRRRHALAAVTAPEPPTRSNPANAQRWLDLRSRAFATFVVDIPWYGVVRVCIDSNNHLLREQEQSTS